MRRVEPKDCVDIGALSNYDIPPYMGLVGEGRLSEKTFQPGESLGAVTEFDGGVVANLGFEIRVRPGTTVGAVRSPEVTPGETEPS
ncbi:MAG: hypothetical protein ACYCST_09415 [Acidimicrobiales bacterium]